LQASNQLPEDATCIKQEETGLNHVHQTSSLQEAIKIRLETKYLLFRPATSNKEQHQIKNNIKKNDIKHNIKNHPTPQLCNFEVETQ